ncbi:Secreted protein [Pseudomonas soli]
MGCFVLLDLLDLAELELHRSRATENEHCNLQAALFVVNLFDGAVEVSKRTINDSNHFTRLEQRLRLRLVTTIGNATEDGLGLFISDRRRLICGTTNETHDSRGILDKVPSPFVHFHLDQYIAREEFALALALLAVAHFNDFFGRDQDLAEFVFHASQLDALDQGAHHMLLVTRVSMHYVPTLSHGTPLANNQGDRPAEQGVEPPQQQRHNQNNSHDNQRGLSGFLAGRPHDFTDLGPRFLRQREERLTLRSLQGNEASNRSQGEKCKNAVQDRRRGVILITHNGDNHQSHYSQPLEQVETRFLGFSFGSHRGGSCKKKANHTEVNGRSGGNRTPNLRFWRPSLCQLSY